MVRACKTGLENTRFNVITHEEWNILVQSLLQLGLYLIMMMPDGWWWPDPWHCQAFSCYELHSINWPILSVTRISATYARSQWLNDINCKYALLFTSKWTRKMQSADKGIIILLQPIFLCHIIHLCCTTLCRWSRLPQTESITSAVIWPIIPGTFHWAFTSVINHSTPNQVIVYCFTYCTLGLARVNWNKKRQQY